MVNVKGFSNAIKTIKSNANIYFHHKLGTKDYPELEEDGSLKVVKEETEEETEVDIAPEDHSDFDAKKPQLEPEEETKIIDENKSSKDKGDDDNSKEDDDKGTPTLKPKSDSDVTPDTVESTGKTSF